MSQSGFIPVSDGSRLHIKEAGSGPALILVPGWGMSAEIWSRQFDYFSSSYKVVSFDPRGQGESGKPADLSSKRRGQDILDLVEALKLKDVVLVGWSLGALDASAALQLGLKVRGAAFIDNTVDKHYASAAAPGARLLTLVQTRPYDTVIAKFVKDMFAKPLDADELQEITASAMKMPRECAIEALKQASSGEGLSSVLKASPIPTWLYMSPRFIKEAQGLAADYPCVKAELIENAGHAVFIDDTEGFDSKLKAFLQSLPQ
jgi:pimeloyl-ACP methyl ester carboxylesterase